MVLIAGQEVNFSNLTKVYQAAKINPLPNAFGTGTISQKTATSPTFVKASSTFSNILRGGELPETFRESVTSTNLINLGKASVDISNALNTVAQGLQSQLNQIKPMIAQVVPQTAAPEEAPARPLSASIKDKGLELGQNLSTLLGVSTSTIGLVIVGIGAYLLVKKIK